jgi:hypothetical protein
MGRVYRVAAGMYLLVSVSACSGAFTDPVGGGNDAVETKTITTNVEAKRLFAELRATAETIDRQLGTTFTGPRSITGAEGTASVNGRKSVSRSESLSSTSTTRSTDLNIAFSDYRSNAANVNLSGTARWLVSYYSRTACSASACASNVDESLALIGESIHVEFEHQDVIYVDDVKIEARRPKDTSRWDVKITTRDGRVLSFSA